jgi:hypothetical protein
MATERRNPLASLVAACLWTTVATATPTTNIWNPNTDIQPKGVVHLGVDNYFSFQANHRPYAAPTDLGLTYGLPYGFEVGVDVFQPQRHPLVFNAKWGVAERKLVPAFAVGIQGVGVHKTTSANIVYGLAAKSWERYGRLTAGPYVGAKNVIGSDNVGAIAAWDRAFGKRWWASVDWASGNNANGALAVGGSFKFTSKVSLIAGYVHYNSKAYYQNDALTTQLDIDF